MNTEVSECLPVETCPYGPRGSYILGIASRSLFTLPSSDLLIVNSQKPWESTFSLPFPLLCPTECRGRKVISLNGEDERINTAFLENANGELFCMT